MAQVEQATSRGGKQYLGKVVNVFNFQNIVKKDFELTQDFGLWSPFGWAFSAGETRLVNCEMPLYIPKTFEIIEAKLLIQTMSTYLEGDWEDLLGNPIPEGYYGIEKIKLYKSYDDVSGKLERRIVYASSADLIIGDSLILEEINGFGEQILTIGDTINIIEYDLKNNIVPRRKSNILY